MPVPIIWSAPVARKTKIELRTVSVFMNRAVPTESVTPVSLPSQIR